MPFEEREWRLAVRLFETLGLDLRAYKRPQLERRLESFMQREGMASLEAMFAAVRKSPPFFEQFHTYLTIHVSDFFRDPPFWNALSQLVTERPKNDVWRVWSAGCSWGAEPVSAALLLESAGRRYDIVATDSDETVLAQARRGKYTTDQLQKVPEPYRRCFREEAGDVELKPLLHGNLSYQRHDVTTTPLPGPFDLIICRNLIIYFEKPVRERVLEGFRGVLAPQGLLFLGATETFLDYARLGFRAVGPSLFQLSAQS